MLSSQVMLRASRAVRLAVRPGTFRVPAVRAFTRSAFEMAKTSGSTSATAASRKPAAAKSKSSATTTKSASQSASSAGRRSKTTATRGKSAAKKRAVKARKRTVKAKAKKTTKKRTRLTEEQKQKRTDLKLREHFRELVEKSLIREEPSSGRFNSWNIFVTQKLRSGKGDLSMAEKFQEAGREYTQLSPAEIEKLQQSAQAESAKASKAYDEWVQKHTPLQILEANRARLSINRKIANGRTGFAITRRTVGRIVDGRQVKRPLQPMSVFYKELGKIEGGLTAYSERWKALSETDKERYVRLSQQDRRRFEEEYEKTYGVKYQPRT